MGMFFGQTGLAQLLGEFVARETEPIHITDVLV